MSSVQKDWTKHSNITVKIFFPEKGKLRRKLVLEIRIRNQSFICLHFPLMLRVILEGEKSKK